MAEAPTWIVLARDVSDSVTIHGQRRTVLAAALDVDTGLIVNVLPGTSVDSVLPRALKAALVSPAAPLPKAVPNRIVAPPELLQDVTAAAAGLSKLANTEVIEGEQMHEAEEILDSLVGHMEGRAQPDDPPSVQDWRQLYGELAAFTEAAPWKRWTDSDWFPARLELDGHVAELDCLVLGNAGVQHGFNAIPDANDLLKASTSGGKNTLEHLDEALIVHLDPWRETHGLNADKARRYGWPSEARFVPSLLTVRDRQPADLSRTDARLLALAIRGVLSQDNRRLVPADTRALTGEFTFEDGAVGRYRIDRP
ncbi:MAG TPA: hypothetical protein VFT62_02125 [Mycobacteriales bacterium]|nr:hypothetical protein [Mycobacteriales bacterium]